MRKKAPITAVILSKNEEKKLKSTLQSITFCSQIIVVDDYSQDKTRSIAKVFGAKVYKRRLSNNFASQRNWAMSRATNDWVLFVDADEIVTKTLSLNVQKAIKSSSINGYLIKRVDIFMGKKLKNREFTQSIVRLARKASGKWTRSVHEVWNVKQPLKQLNGELLHNSHDSMDQFFTQLSFHATLHAIEKDRKESKFLLLRTILYPSGKFLRDYVFRKGFIDGTHGFVLCVMMSFHSFLAWSSLWFTKKQKNYLIH